MHPVCHGAICNTMLYIASPVQALIARTLNCTLIYEIFTRSDLPEEFTSSIAIKRNNLQEEKWFQLSTKHLIQLKMQ